MSKLVKTGVSNAPLGDVPWTRTPRDNGAVRTAFGCATFFGDIALEPSEAVGDETDPDKLRGYFTQALLAQALEVARGIEYEEDRARAVAALAPHLGPGLLPQALEAARGIEYEGHRAE